MLESKIEQFLNLARQGPIRARDLEAHRIPRTYLRRLCDRGILERVDRGLYCLIGAEVTELHSIAMVAKRVPHATICLISALQIHELTTEAPHAVWVMIDRHAHLPASSYPRLEIVRASGLARDHGVQHRIIEGVEARLTTPAKTVADCFRYRSHVGLDVAIEALRDFLKRSRGGQTGGVVSGIAEGRGSDTGFGSAGGGGRGESRGYQIDALIEAARADRVYTLMRPYLEALV